MRSVTQADIARILGVSQTTVGLVVGRSSSQRGMEKLKPETVEKIRLKAAEMGYRPHRHAQVMREGRARLIAMIHSSGLLEVSNERMRFSAEAIKSHGYELLLLDKQWHSGGVAEIMERVLDAKVAGVICSLNLRGEENNPFEARNIPTVGLSSSEHNDTPLVRCDMRDGFRKITNHLLEQGHRRLVQFSACVEPELPFQQWRWQVSQQAFGFRDCLMAASGDHQVLPIEEYPRWFREMADFPGPAGVTLYSEEVESAIDDPYNLYFQGGFFSRQLPADRALLPDAILCPNDDWAVGAASELMRRRVSIPDDVAVTGFNGSFLSATFPVPLTTLRQPTKEMSELAVALVIAKIEGKSASPKIYDMPGELIVRASSLRSNS